MATLIIKNSAHDGYRRAGRAFAHGENRLPLEEVTQDQRTALENDPHLVVAVEAAGGPGDDLLQREPVDAGHANTPAKVEEPGGLAALTTTLEPALNGSSTLPALIEIGTEQVQLGDIVQIAFNQSELSVEDWNSLADDIRDAHLQGVIDVARQAADQPPPVVTTPAKPAVKAAAKPRAPRGTKAKAE